ncbi:MAG: SPFH domain-containing protein [Armatimonadetes bacterium]|nr:SPFH domain-containing protein [Armatimonadota bacterium]
MKERNIRPQSGALMLVVTFLVFVGMIASFVMAEKSGNDMLIWVGLALVLVFTLIVPGFFVVEPNGSKVLLLFGKYVGTVKEDGFFWTNPFQTKRNLSRRVRTLNGEKLKVNDAAGNPIEIAIIVVWRVVDTYSASFEVENYENYVFLQSESSLRHSAGSYPYDDEDHAISLRQNADEVSENIRSELQNKLQVAGIEVIEAKIAHLAYAQEIAGAMLRRQQAAAVISARQKIVEGAVGMVEMALTRMEADGVIDLDEERKAAMVSNLMVVLCSEHAAQPIVNSGSVY